MHPKTRESVVPKAMLHRNLAVMDIVYNPLETQLLADAAACGLTTISGVEMFADQAVIQFELWTGKKAPREVMPGRAGPPRRARQEAMNLVLIGYRGTGKSTIARLLSRRLSRDVVSLDQEIVRDTGRSIPEIVAEHGWPHFRDIEADVTRRVAARDDLIIDAGGGVILRRRTSSTCDTTAGCSGCGRRYRSSSHASRGAPSGPPSSPASRSPRRSRRCCASGRRSMRPRHITRSTPTAARRQTSPRKSPACSRRREPRRPTGSPGSGAASSSASRPRERSRSSQISRSAVA